MKISGTQTKLVRLFQYRIVRLGNVLFVTDSVGLDPFAVSSWLYPEHLRSGCHFLNAPPHCVLFGCCGSLLPALGFIFVFKFVPQVCSALPFLCLEKQGYVSAVVVRCNVGRSRCRRIAEDSPASAASPIM